MMKQQMLLLSAMPYNITSEQGQVIEGISVHYIPTTSLDPVSEGTLKGLRVAKISLPITKEEKMKNFPFPAIYDTTLEMTVVQGKMQVKITDIDLVGTVTLTLNKK